MTGERAAVKRHAEFIMLLGPRLLGRYSDGGATLHRVDRSKGRAAKAARKRNRKR